jgi:hypothetical protein
LCLLVFLLALSAKLALYRQSANVPQANAISCAKLWLNGDKMEAEPRGAANRHSLADQRASGFVPLLWLAIVLFFRSVQITGGRTEKRDRVFIPRHSCLLHLERFLRPPPAIFAF